MGSFPISPNNKLPVSRKGFAYRSLGSEGERSQLQKNVRKHIFGKINLQNDSNVSSNNSSHFIAHQYPSKGFLKSKKSLDNPENPQMISSDGYLKKILKNTRNQVSTSPVQNPKKKQSPSISRKQSPILSRNQSPRIQRKSTPILAQPPKKVTFTYFASPVTTPTSPTPSFTSNRMVVRNISPKNVN